MFDFLACMFVLLASKTVAQITKEQPRISARAQSTPQASIALTTTHVSTVLNTLQDANMATRTLYLTPDKTKVVATETLNADTLETVVRTQIVAASTFKTEIDGTKTATLAAVLTSRKVNTGVAEIVIAATKTATLGAVVTSTNLRTSIAEIEVGATRTATLAALQTQMKTKTAVLGDVITVTDKTATGTLASIQHAATVTLISNSSTELTISTTQVPTTIFVTVSGQNAIRTVTVSGKNATRIVTVSGQNVTRTVTAPGETTITEQARGSTVTQIPEADTIIKPITRTSATTIFRNGTTVTTTSFAQGFTVHKPIPILPNRTITEVSIAPTTVVVGASGSVTKTARGTTSILTTSIEVTKERNVTTTVLANTPQPITLTEARTLTLDGKTVVKPVTSVVVSAPMLSVTKSATITSSVVITKTAPVAQSTVAVNSTIRCPTCSGGYATVTKTVPGSSAISSKPYVASVVQTVEAINGKTMKSNLTLPCGIVNHASKESPLAGPSLGSTTKGPPVSRPGSMAATTVTSVITHTTRKCASCPFRTATSVMSVVLPVRAKKVRRYAQVALNDNEETVSISSSGISDTSSTPPYSFALFAASSMPLATPGPDSHHEFSSPGDAWPLPTPIIPLPTPLLLTSTRAAVKVRGKATSATPSFDIESASVPISSSTGLRSSSGGKTPFDRDSGACPEADLSEARRPSKGPSGTSPMDVGGFWGMSSSATGTISFLTGYWFVAVAVGAQVVFMML